jgi:hypothetical protein
VNKLTKKQLLVKEALFLQLHLIAMEDKDFDSVVYNEAIQNLNSFIAETRDEMQMYFDERSDKWQESEKGTYYQDWIDNWDVEYDEVESFDDVELPEEIDLNNEPEQ